MTSLSKDRFAGCLIGQCVGDALGFLVEGRSPEECAVYARDWVRTRRPPPMTRDGFAFGQYSDDSQLARELLISYAALGRFDPADYARRIGALFAEGRVVGEGRTTAQAARRLIEGMAWDEAGAPPPAAGNGSAMRAGPIGLMHGEDTASLIRNAHDQGRITHADPRCSAGAVVIAGAVALAARGRPVDAGFLEPLRNWAQRLDPTMAGGLRQLRGVLDLPPGQAAKAVSQFGLPPGVDSRWRGGISAFVVPSVLWALYAFLRNPRDYVETIAIAIEGGGDTDSVAAMAGAISGAHLGLSAIPTDFVRRLNDKGQWGYESLIALAEKCWRISAPAEA
ncbi:ADP-ribosylglycohydrolase family protein [Telmatospirillum sp. J64-1]|uniref:ADP-ribosylglycohydrolase family protein n=1 Tax=Telmatospirillum sp. J64-1 TaxID=2502183 RepID=UPI00115D1EBF|nr:ADP-ribosylglycohydrolase family protein [Telmatospirillum sp. J64-1]